MARPPGDVPELFSRMQPGQRVKFQRFWGHQPERDATARPELSFAACWSTREDLIPWALIGHGRCT